MMVDTAALNAEWTAALEDAGIDRTSTRLFVSDDSKASDESGAVWFRPGSEIGEGDQIQNPTHITDANKPEHVELHRIGVWRGVEVPVLAGRLRHELEHARQWDRFEQSIYDLYDLIHDEVLPHKAGGLKGCKAMYFNAIPAEQDANAAAAMFLRSRHSKVVGRLCQDADNRVLACSLVGPQALDTLPARMIAFAFLHRDCCAQVAEKRETPFNEILDACFDSAGDYWLQLCERACSVSER